MRCPAAIAAVAWLPGLLVEAQQAQVRSPASFFAKNTKVLENCYFVDRRYTTEHAVKFTNQGGDFHDCQRKCQNFTNCEYFGFWQETQTCWLAGADAVFTDYLASGAVAGPKVCPNPPAACAEVPGPGFPGAGPEETKTTWPSHRVPEKLECWPKNVSGGFYDSCPDIVVLEDKARGWPGLCKGTHKVLVPWGETCESYCRKKVSCSVYQVMNDTGKSCYHSKLYGGSDCYMRNPEVPFMTPTEAKRIMHGRIRVLKDTTGVQILGLVQAFDQNYFLNVTRDAVPACRNNCYSNLGCQWWQYSKISGCWVEDPRTPVAWPMTQDYWKTDTDFAATVIGGEYIQHVCPGRAGLPADYGSTVTGLPSDSSGFPSGFPTQAPLAPPAEASMSAAALEGVLTIHGLDFGTLTEAQRQTLGDDCTGAIATALGVSRSGIKDDTCNPGQVSLAPIEDGTHVEFTVDKPQGMSTNDVSRALLEPSFISQVKGSAERLRGGGQGGGLPGEGFPALEELSVHSLVMDSTPAPTVPPAPAMPVLPVATVSPGTAPTLPATKGGDEGEGLSFWFLALLVPVALVIVLGGCAYLYTQKYSGNAREHKAHQKKSPGKGSRREQDGVPLLSSTSPSASQLSSESHALGMSAMSSTPPLSSPYMDFQGAPPPQGRDDPAKLKLEASFDAEASGLRGAGVGAPDGQDIRSSVLNAAFDIIDVNHDNVVTPSELQRFNYGPGAAVPSLQPPNLAASLRPQRPLAVAVPGALRPPSLPAGPLPPGVAIPGPRPTGLPVQAAQGTQFVFRR